MKADSEFIQVHPLQDRTMDGLHSLASLDSTRNIRLIRHDNQSKPRCPQFLERLRHPGKDLEFVRVRRWVRFPVSHHCTVDHPISVQKHGPSGHRETDSHLVSDFFNVGWETRRCQTTE